MEIKYMIEVASQIIDEMIAILINGAIKTGKLFGKKDKITHKYKKPISIKK